MNRSWKPSAGPTTLSPRLEQWRRRGETLQLGGHRLFYRQAGAGPPLLLLHAYPTASWGFHKMWPALTERFNVIAPDLLGSGFSDKPAADIYRIEALADQVEALLAARSIEQPHVLAHAYGVTTAQELLARHQERGQRGDEGLRLRSACFVNGGLFPEGTRPTPTQKMLLSPLGPLIAHLAPHPYAMFRRKLACNFGPKTQPTEEELRELWQVLRYNNGHRIVPRTLQYLKQRIAMRPRWVGALTEADIPLALINGAADPVSGEHVPQLWREHLPEAPLYQLNPAIGHYPPLEDPEGTLEAFLHFIESRLSGASPRDSA